MADRASSVTGSLHGGAMSKHPDPEEILHAQAMLAVAEKAFQSYNPKITTVDSHFEDWASKKHLKDDEEPFVQQLFYGAVRNRKVLDVLLNALYHAQGAELPRSAHDNLVLIAFCVMFRADDLGQRRLEAILQSTQLARTHTLLTFLLNPEMLERWCVEPWSKVVDRSFIEGRIMGGLRKQEPALRRFMKRTEHAAFGAERAGTASEPGSMAAGGRVSDGGFDATSTSDLGNTSASAVARRLQTPSAGGAPAAHTTGGKRPPTVPKPFALTRPRPRVVPEPERVETTVHLKPIPASTYDRALGDVTSAAEERRKQAAEATRAKYLKPGLAFRLHETRNTVDRVRQEVEAQREAELDFDRPKMSKPPRLPRKGADVKLNTAAVLREAHRVREKQAKEAEALQRYEAELRDASQFHSWQDEVRAKDEAARLAAVEARRAEMAEAARAGVEAAAASKRSKARVADAAREESRLSREQQRLEKLAQSEANRALAQDVREVRREAPRRAEAEVRRRREAKAKALREQKERMAALVKQRAAQKEAKARDRKMQLQALEKAPRPRVTAFDPARAAGHGLMCEMSLVEARERIEMRRAREKEEEEERRQQIRRERREKEDRLRGHLDAMRTARGAAAVANREAREHTKEERAREKATEAARLESAAVTLAERLAAKRAAREAEQAALEEEEAKTKRRSAFLGAAAEAVAKRRLGQGQLNAERSAQRAQDAAREAAKVEAAAAMRGIRDRGTAEAVVHRAKVRTMAGRARRFAAADEEKAEFSEAGRQAAKESFVGEAAREARMQAAKVRNNVYAATISEQHAETARRRRAPWLSSRAEQREEVMQGRLGRLSEDQALRTGMAQTAARVAASGHETKRRSEATMQRSALETQKLAKGMGATRATSRAGSKVDAGATAGGPGVVRNVNGVRSSKRGARGGEEASPMRRSESMRRGGAAVLQPVPSEAATWRGLGEQQERKT